MKKLFAFLLCIFILSPLCMSVSAKALTYKHYPLFDSDGNMTEGVRFFINGTEVDYKVVKARAGKAYPDNCIGNNSRMTLPAKLIIWTPGKSNVNHMPFQTGIRIVEGTVVEITFTGAGFKLISNYAENTFIAPNITVDGEDIKCDISKVSTGSNTTIAKTDKLDYAVHTIVITGMGDVEFDSFKVSGELGAKSITDDTAKTENEKTEEVSADTEPSVTDISQHETVKDTAEITEYKSDNAPKTEPVKEDDIKNDSLPVVPIVIAAIALFNFVILVAVICSRRK